MSVCPRVTDDLVIYKAVEQDVLDFIRPGGTNNLILLCDLCQNFLEFLWCTRLKYHMSMVWRVYGGRVLNCMLCFDGCYSLVGKVEYSRVGGWCCLRKGGIPGALIRHAGSQCHQPVFPHPVLGKLLGLCFPHTDTMRQRYVLSYECCELWWVLMVWWVDVCIVIMGMLCILGGRWVCCIVGICTVDIR